MSFFDLSQPIPPVILLIIFCAMVGLMAHADHCERRSKARLMDSATPGAAGLTRKDPADGGPGSQFRGRR